MGIFRIRNKLGDFLLMLGVTLISFEASAVGLTRTTGILERFKTELTTIIPLVAIIALILMAVAYAMKIVEKDTFIRWSIGIIIAGSASEITTLFTGA